MNGEPSAAERVHFDPHEVLFVMAVEAEWGPHLRDRFTPLMTGVGPVEAGVRVAAELARRAMTASSPQLVVSIGSAGSRVLTQAHVYQVSTVSYRDIDASAVGFPAGCTPFVDLPAAVPLPYLIDGVPTASLSTGGNMVSGAAYDSIDADMVDMETFAVMRACQHAGVPMLGLRGISDGDDELNHVDDWTQHLQVIDERLAAAVDELLATGVTVLGDRVHHDAHAAAHTASHTASNTARNEAP